MRSAICFVLSFAGVLPAQLAADPSPLKVPDVLAWKRIQTPVVSNDGQWFAYKLSPNDGDSEVVLTHLVDRKEQRFPIGLLERPNPYLGGGGPPPAGPPHDLVFSADSKWLALEEHPTQKETNALRKQHKPVENKVLLVEVATGKKTEFERVKRFSFSGDKSTAIALHRYGAAPATPPAAATPGAPKPEDKPQGSDLILVDFPTGTELSLGNVSDFAFDKPGNWLAWVVDAQDKLGNGVELRNLASGTVLALDTAKATYRGLNWTEKGDGLAVLRGIEDKKWEDKVYSLLAFRRFGDAGSPEKLTFSPDKEPSFPTGMGISAERRPAWMADLSTVTFGIHELKAKEQKAESAGKKPEDAEEKPDLVIWHWKDSRLQPMQQVQENRDKNFSFLCSWKPDGHNFYRLADSSVRDVSVAPEGQFGLGSDVREYELAGNLNGQRYQDIYKVDPRTGKRELILTKVRWMNGISPDGTHVLFNKDGAFSTVDLTNGQTHELTKGVSSTFYDTEDDHNIVKLPTPVIGWSKDSKFVLISDGWDIWKIGTDGGPAVNLTGNGRRDKIRYESIWRLDPDDKGYDLSKTLYIRAYGQLSKKNGIAAVEPGAAGIRTLTFDDAGYSNVLKAKNTDVFVYSRETPQEYGDYYVANHQPIDGKRVSSANPQQKNFQWTKGSKIIEYTGGKGDKLQGVLYLPGNYEPGKKYPTIVYIYEKLSQNRNLYSTPTLSGFNVAYYTSNGYAVFTPDITYRVNDPGLSSVSCILAALKAAEATGVVDETRVALHGHSWGGYQTAFAVTQTKVFKAAIAGAPLTDMISMYSSIYWNTGSANQPIFESSQGRFTGGYWEQMQAYIRNSPVYHAEQVQTPLLMLVNDKDGAVDHTQGIEYYNTLRRLNKPVVMLEYKGENHGLFKQVNINDYSIRMKEFFDYYLMDKPAPKWWTDGVPRLKMTDELEEREKERKKQKPPTVPTDAAAPIQ